MTVRNEKKAEIGQVSLQITGDTSPNRDNPGSIFKYCSDILEKADINICCFGNSISTRPVQDPYGPSGFCLNPKDVTCLSENNFHAVSMSGHAMAGGKDAFLDTLEILRENNIQPIGVGPNLDEARKPVIIERGGTKIAFLSYNSVESVIFADKNRPGNAAIRIHTFYEQTEIFPGGPGRVHTCPYHEDLVAMRRDIKKARELADIVVFLWHAGMLFIRAEIPEYQQEIAYAAMDAGADIVVCSHPHIFKGVEVYKGKVIFYGIGDFAYELPPDTLKLPPAVLAKMMKGQMDRYGLTLTPEDPRLGWFPADSRKTMIAKILIEAKQISSVSFIPVICNKQSEPQPMKFGSQGFDTVSKYITDITKEAGFETQFQVSGDEVKIITNI